MYWTLADLGRALRVEYPAFEYRTELSVRALEGSRQVSMGGVSSFKMADSLTGAVAGCPSIQSRTRDLIPNRNPNRSGAKRTARAMKSMT